MIRPSATKAKRRMPRPIKDKHLQVTAYEADSGYSDGVLVKWPREVSVDTGECLNARKVRKLIKWLNEALAWMESK